MVSSLKPYHYTSNIQSLAPSPIPVSLQLLFAFTPPLHSVRYAYKGITSRLSTPAYRHHHTASAWRPHNTFFTRTPKGYRYYTYIIYCATPT